MQYKLVAYKKFLFAAAVLLFFAVCYQLAFKATIVALKLNMHLKDRVSNATLTSQPQYLFRQNKALVEIIQTFSTDTLTYRNKMADEISLIAEKEGTRVVELPAQALAFNNQVFVQKVRLSGDFKHLLNTLYQCEAAKDIGYLRSVVLKKVSKTDSGIKTNTVTLDLTSVITK